MESELMLKPGYNHWRTLLEFTRGLRESPACASSVMAVPSRCNARPRRAQEGAWQYAVKDWFAQKPDFQNWVKST